MTNKAQVCWVVNESEAWEGRESLGIFSTREKAVEFINRYIDSEFSICHRYKYNEKKKIWEAGRKGNHWIEIEEHTLDESFLDENSNK